jgi:hypothetical protein
LVLLQSHRTIQSRQNYRFSWKPLQAVSVIIRGTKTGTSTNATGEFQLNGVPERSTLVLSFVGLATQEVRLSAGQRSVNVVMREDVSNLQGVVVTGFQRIDKKSLQVQQ